MRLDIIRPALVTLVLALSGLPDGAVTWDDEPRGTYPSDAPFQIRMAFVASARIGASDAEGWEDGTGDNDGKIVQRISGWRMVTWSITCDSLESSNALTAHAVLETVRDCLQWRSSREALKAVGASPQGEQQIQRIPGTADARVMPSAVYDVLLCIQTATPGADAPLDLSNPIDWIDTVEVTEI